MSSQPTIVPGDRSRPPSESQSVSTGHSSETYRTMTPPGSSRSSSNNRKFIFFNICFCFYFFLNDDDDYDSRTLARFLWNFLLSQ